MNKKAIFGKEIRIPSTLDEVTAKLDYRTEKLWFLRSLKFNFSYVDDSEIADGARAQFSTWVEEKFQVGITVLSETGDSKNFFVKNSE